MPVVQHIKKYFYKIRTLSMNLLTYFKVVLQGNVKFIGTAISVKPKVSRALFKQVERQKLARQISRFLMQKSYDVKKRNSTLCPLAMHSNSHLLIQERETCLCMGYSTLCTYKLGGIRWNIKIPLYIKSSSADMLQIFIKLSLVYTGNLTTTRLFTASVFVLNASARPYILWFSYRYQYYKMSVVDICEFLYKAKSISVSTQLFFIDKIVRMFN
jgi:hypothetical protein